jgi:hypothetical protein
VIELGCFDEVAQLVEVLFRLTGMADDESGADEHVRHTFAHEI